MNSNKAQQNKILSIIGLKRHMVSQASSFSVYNSRDFRQYVPKGYRGSETEEADEIYRMSEIALLHKIIGLRISYITSESYDGETMDYNLKDIFIITQNGKKLEVLDIDLDNELFITTDNPIGFDDVSMHV